MSMEETEVLDLDAMSDEEFEKAFQEQAADFAQADRDEVEARENEEQGIVSEPEEVDEQEETIETAEEVDEGTAEQPETDNSDEAAEEDSDQEQADDETADDATEEGSESDEDTSTPEDEEQPAKEDEPTVTTEAEVHKVKANGNEYDFTLDELKIMASKGMNYTQKMQRFAQHKEQISMLEDAKVSNEDLNLMINVLKGDNRKEAVTDLIKKLDLDVAELDTEEPTNYVPKTYGRSATELGIDEVVTNIQGDPEYKTTEYVLANRLDAESKAYFAENPNEIYVLHNDIKDGRYSEISARADKLMQLEVGKVKPYVDYYIQAGNDYLQDLQKQKADESAKAEATKKAEADRIAAEKAKIAKQEKAKKQAEKNKAAGITRNKSTANNTVKDYLEDDMSDEDFLKMYDDKIKG